MTCKFEWSFHPFAELLPLVKGRQFEELVASIDQNVSLIRLFCLEGGYWTGATVSARLSGLGGSRS